MSTDGERPDKFKRTTTTRRIFDEDETLATEISKAMYVALSTDGESPEHLTDHKEEDENLVTGPSRNALKEIRLSKTLKHIFSNMKEINFTPIESEADGVHITPQESNKIINFESDEKLRSFINTIIEKEFPPKNPSPSARDVINIGNFRENETPYVPGTWVEIEGPDMKWRLDMITRTVKQAPDDWDWNDPNNEDKEPRWVYYYHAGSERRFREEDVRSSEEGLKRVFGNRPWIWQQWAMLKLEEKLRFQEGHQHDCMEMDVQKYGADLWDHWLEHPSNLEFKKVFNDDRVGNFGRSELLNHIQKPFHLIDRLKEDKDEWNFDDDANISVFTYTSMLGVGAITPMVVLLIQLAIPIIFFIEALSELRCTSTDAFDHMYARLMSLIIFFLYTITVFPDSFTRFYDVEGAGDSVYSRLLSLRRQLWDQGDDTITQMIGYKTDVVMSIGYESMLSMFNVFLILNTDDALAVLLDALAFVFVAKIDEEIVNSSWWDPQSRWITAGTTEVIMARTIRLRSLASPSLFSTNFGVPRQLLIDACGEDENLFKNTEVAKSDADDVKYLTNEERVLHLFRDAAKERGNKNALDEYRKPTKYFAVMGPVFGYLGIATPVFMTFQSFRTWSRWTKVLYLAPVPDLENVFDYDANEDTHILSSMLHDIKSTKEKPFANFYPSEEGLSKNRLFVRHIISVLKHDLPNGLRSSRRQGEDHRVLRVIVYTFGYVMTVGAYLLQTIFPIVLAIAIGSTIYELFSKECVAPLFVF